MALTLMSSRQGADLLALMQAQRVFARPLALAHAQLDGLEDQQIRRQLLAAAILADPLMAHLRQAWGPSQGKVPLQEGKQGQVFFFQHGHDVVMALAAPLPRGTSWWWVTDTARDWPVVPYPVDHPAVARFWPWVMDALLDRWMRDPEHAKIAYGLNLSVAQQILQHRSIPADDSPAS